MKKILAKTLAIGSATVLLTACGDFEEELEILTGGEQGAYYPLGGQLSTLINENVEEYDASHFATSASVVNLNDIADDQGDLALTQNDTAYYAVNGDVDFEEPLEGFGGMATLYPEVIQIVATEASGIETVDDLEGMSVAVGDAGSGTEVVSQQILEAHGITYDDITVEYQDFENAADGLQDENIDAALMVAGAPTGAIEALAAQQDITMVDVDEAVAGELIEEYPYYTEHELEEGLYNDEDDTVSTLAVQAMLVAHDELDDEIVYEVMEVIFDNTDSFETAHESGSYIDLETAEEGMPIDLHPGAEQFFEDQ
ncbi:TAXI family TRAP transporter solute-binding subunit [Salicibibacter kimchii]|uniref:C4-dicarboxylate ABC transporter substrate-binding protein n=1 Tax=Salicibibacter kimchii TaxID=2099786 RepID=A0A345C1A9_9BACI|nr:TAXI family TRAP transporter solute-binding subunit [Salicibibacter kimchii]AXF56990.1 C4-dicarboxylate ABC transporter substrate-binding protein [Salicibibacter kimchii]